MPGRFAWTSTAMFPGLCSLRHILVWARGMSCLEESLNLEYRLVTRLFRHGEFIEGIRALLVDKDKAPKWNPPTVAEVTDEMVGAFLAPLAAGEALTLTPPGDG